jgi:hypothetical protein
MEVSVVQGGSDITGDEHGGGMEDYDLPGIDPWDNSDDDSEWEQAQDDVDDPAESQFNRDTGWAHAIVLSEILREPRVKRPWPNR